MPNRNPVYVVQHNHFDPIWRRCWDRTFDYKGVRYRSYAELEERFINIWLESARRGGVFSEGQAVVFRKYLERNPERLEEMRRLVASGVIELTAAGETVADTNMPSGETLLRNLVMGQRYFEDTFGVIPGIGWLEDAFGQSAQMPQLFRGVECRQVMRLSYKRVPGEYWKGLDGSVVYTGDGPFNWGAGHCIKIAPCPECSGMGCAKCAQTGLSDTSHVTDEMLEQAFTADFKGEPYSLLAIGGEEAVPNPRIADLVQEARQKLGVDFQWGGFGVMSRYLGDAIDRVDDPDVPVSEQVEANPVSTGCYVSRIGIKQSFRRAENIVNAAERWATIAHLLGAEYPSEELTDVWQSLLFVAFHDAITSTHIDSAYCELTDMLEDSGYEAGSVTGEALDEIGWHIASDVHRDYLVIYNSESWDRDDPVTITLCGTRGRPAMKDASGREIEVLDSFAEGKNVTFTLRPPKVPALGYAAVEIVEDAEPIHAGDIIQGPGEIENEFYRIRTSEHGIESVFDKRIGAEILDTGSYLCNELLLEEDAGHPWGTMQPPSFEERLGKYTTDVRIRRSAGVSEIILTGSYKGSDRNTKILTWRQWTRIYSGYERIDFRTAISWDTAQRRIRIAFPSNIKTDEGVYAIPYGALKRSSYESDMTGMPSTNGDWPAINWVDIYDEAQDRGIALINTGTPSHKIVNGVLFLSVLRSPTDSWCLNEPEFYDCPDFDGARDAGEHEFAYSLIPHAGDHRAASIEKRAREVNLPLAARRLTHSGEGKLGLSHSFLKLDAPDNVIVTALKKSDRDDSVIVRLAETGGLPAEASVAIEGAGNRVTAVNFLERNPQAVSGAVPVGPFKIVTLRFGR